MMLHRAARRICSQMLQSGAVPGCCSLMRILPHWQVDEYTSKAVWDARHGRHSLHAHPLFGALPSRWLPALQQFFAPRTRD